MDWLWYWWSNIKDGFQRWERVDAVIALLLAFVVVVSWALPQVGIRLSWLADIPPLAAFALIVFFIWHIVSKGKGKRERA
jgi:hypothetical protein